MQNPCSRLSEYSAQSKGPSERFIRIKLCLSLLGSCPPAEFDLVGSLMIHIGVASLDELEGQLIQLLEVI